MAQHLPEGYYITTDRSLMSVAAIHQYLSTESYWAKDIPIEVVQRAFDNSFVVAALYGNEQVGFARFVTDYAIFAYLADVYVSEAHRGLGLSKAMMECLMGQTFVSGLRRLSLATRDAHGLYRQFGFSEPAKPETNMEIVRPNMYSLQKHPDYELSTKQH